MSETAVVTTALLYAAVPPDEAQRTRFLAFLEKKYGPGVELSWQQSDAFPGGFRMEVGDDIYDWSVNGRFQQLKDTLTKVPHSNGNIIPLLKETILSWTPKAMAQPA